MKLLVTLAAAVLLPATLATAAFPTLHLKPIVQDQLFSPVNISHAGDGSGRLFVCDQPGRIWIVQGGMMLPTPFLDLTSTGTNVIFPAPNGYSERGLLGLAFHPDYSTPAAAGEGRFYVYYSAPSQANQNPSTPQNHITVVSEFKVSTTDPNAADPASERVLMTFGQPQGNHNGGQLKFGPDGYLYIGSGDGGGAGDDDAGHTGSGSSGPLGNSLDLTNLLGKILRIDVLGNNGTGGEYGIPATNPFATSGGGVKKEIYAYGLRNPWRFSFDQRPGGTNRLFCGDVGQGEVEEINLITSGGNYGWRYKEGSFVYDPNMVGAGTAPASSIDPIAEYAHPGITIGSPPLPQLGVSVAGGYVYRGSAIPALVGKYLFADYRAASGQGGRLMGLEETGPLSGVFNLTNALPLTESNPLGGSRRILVLGEDEDGELWVATKTNGGVLQLDGGFPAGDLYKIVAPSESNTTLAAVADTVLFADTDSIHYSNGAGQYLFAGSTASAINWQPRRSLLRFDPGSLPAGATVSSATLNLTMNRTIAGSFPFTLHRVLTTWGEGASNAGDPGGTGAPAQVNDATWLFNQVNVPGDPPTGSSWTAPGGDFVTTASATTSVSSNGTYQWSDSGMVDDLNAWLATPGDNFGWLLKGPEAPTTTEAKRFYSRDDATPSNRPALDIGYLVPPAPLPFEDFLSTYYPAALTGEFIDPKGDDDGDSIPLQIEQAYGFSPLVFNPADTTEFTTSTAPGAGGTIDLTITFRRDPTATDLTLNLQVGDDLIGWTTVAQSVGGNPPVAQNGGTIVSDSLLSNPVRKTTVRVNLPGTTERQFTRLEVIRSGP